MKPPLLAVHVVLVGMMGAGKTTTGMALAARLGWPIRDGDVELERRTGRSGAEVAATEGIERLHELEVALLADALAAPPPSIVVAAGSVVASPPAIPLLATAVVVWLDAPVDELVVRMASGTHRRSLDRDAVAALVEGRRSTLEELADLRLDARRPTDQLVDRIVEALAAGRDRSL